MKIKYGKQTTISEIKNIDIFIMANNFEERKLSSFKQLNNIIKIESKIALKYSNSGEANIENFINCEIKKDQDLIDIFLQAIKGISNKNMVIFIDYSCMTKSWYYSLIISLSTFNISKKITVYFSYTPSKYSEPRESNIIKEYYPIHKSYLPDSKPKLLIVCLGYEQNKAQGIIDFIDPAITYIFYTKPAIEQEFVKKVEENNKEVLEAYNEYGNIITFPFDDLLYLEKYLSSIIIKFKDNYNIIIAPLGPKPFTFTSMILSTLYPSIEIWRVSTDTEHDPFKSTPIEKNFIINEVVYE